MAGATAAFLAAAGAGAGAGVRRAAASAKASAKMRKKKARENIFEVLLRAVGVEESRRRGKEKGKER